MLRWSDWQGWLANNWLEALITLGLTLLAFGGWQLLGKRLDRLFGRKENLVLGKSLWQAFGKPLHLCIAVVGGLALAKIVLEDLAASWLPQLELVRYVLLAWLLAWAIWRLVGQMELRSIQAGRDITTVSAIGKIAKATILVLTALTLLQRFGASLSGLLAFGGVGGLVVGMAAKDLLANFFGALMIYLDRPFKVGDWIRSPDRAIEGTVEKIGWRLTVIRTFDKRPLFVPNSVFTAIAVENPSRMHNRRIYETVGIRYQDAERLPAIITKVKQMLCEHPEIDTSQTLIVNFNQFGPSSLDFFVYTFTRTTEWVYYHEVKQDVLLKILAIITKEGAEVAFPSRTLYIEPSEAPSPFAQPG